MAHPINFFIRDANGQPQMLKVVPSKHPVGQIQLPSSAMKTIFKPSTSEVGTVCRVNMPIVKGQKCVQIHREAISQLQKSVLDDAQAAPVTKKVQSINVSDVSKTIQKVTAIPQSTKQVVHIGKPDSEKDYGPNTILGYKYRKRHEVENDVRMEYDCYNSSKRRKIVEKVGKGLRHFSMKVCEKVRKKGFTSYNEVADELVTEFTEGLNTCPDTQHYDQKNIRRRVYDALNVLMAMNIISKEKKEIRWLGLPTNSVQECTSLEAEKQIKLERIQQKTQQLHDLILKQISFKSLVERNKEAECKGITPSSSIQLPFIVVNTNKDTEIKISVSEDKMEYVFQFSEKFQIQDDIDILKRMGLLLGLDKGNCSEANLRKVKNMIPKSLESYIDQLGKGEELNFEDILSNIKCENEEIDEICVGDDEFDDCDFSGAYSDDDFEDSCSDLEVN